MNVSVQTFKLHSTFNVHAEWKTDLLTQADMTRMIILILMNRSWRVIALIRGMFDISVV